MNAADGNKITGNRCTQTWRLLELYKLYNLKTYTIKTITVLPQEKSEILKRLQMRFIVIFNHCQ